MAKKTFEQAMGQLEKIVQELESGNLTLEQALKKYEEGVHLSKFCNQKLDETEKRIHILMEDENGDIIKTPFADQDTVEK